MKMPDLSNMMSEIDKASATLNHGLNKMIQDNPEETESVQRLMKMANEPMNELKKNIQEYANFNQARNTGM